ncbi:hypothetical protein [Actinomadura sp. B10D3]|uniref:hypothetical protein n=1 Tax=Actinomadura sp. B10D3 TaxID=3153557 RepID=UPI00325CBA83
MDGDDRASRLRARRGGERRPDQAGARAKQRREADEYARQAMVSSARAHDRAASLLEGMAAAHPEEADLHLQSAARHRKWAENDRELARKYAPHGGPDGL